MDALMTLDGLLMSAESFTDQDIIACTHRFDASDDDLLDVELSPEIINISRAERYFVKQGVELSELATFNKVDKAESTARLKKLVHICKFLHELLWLMILTEYNLWEHDGNLGLREHEGKLVVVKRKKKPNRGIEGLLGDIFGGGA